MMPEEIDVLVLSAFADEMSHYHANIPGLSKTSTGRMEYYTGTYKGQSIALATTGLGKLQATSSCHFALSEYKPKYMIFTGTSGAVDTTLKTGDVVIGEKCIDADLLGIHKLLRDGPFEPALKRHHGEGEIPEEYNAAPGLVTLAQSVSADWLHTGILATSDNFPSPKDKIKPLRAASVSTMDMECSAFYHTAGLYKIPALAIRSVSNELDEKGDDKDVDKADVTSANRPATIVLHMIENLSSIETKDDDAIAHD